MDPRPLTQREASLLHTLLAVDFPGAETLRRQGEDASVVATCECGCPSVDFVLGRGQGMNIKVNAGVRGRSHDGLFLWTIDDADHGELLGGIEWLANSDLPDPDELPDPDSLVNIQPA